MVFNRPIHSQSIALVNIRMANVVNFTTGELDFDSIATSLRNYMQYQTEFKDYNFQGSALSTLINLLAYNTHYNGLYDNFALNESFLDSAYKRESVVSHASLLNYIPRSAHGAIAKINVTIYDDRFNSTATTVTLPKYSVFTTNVDGVDYSFYTDSAIDLTRNNSSFSANDVIIRQGRYITLQRTYQGDSAQKFVLNGTNVDIDTVGVQVLHDQRLYTFTKADNILANTSESRVYFVSMTAHDQYQIEFGSGILGYSLSAGDTVYITYLATGDDPTVANGASVFNYQGTLSSLGFSSSAYMTITTTQRATGGAYPESTESIRSLAPKIFTTQDRCVTANDYRAMLLKNFENIRAINVWGGQDNNPPQYGKVFISIIPKSEQQLTTVEKNQILSILNTKKELTKLIEFVEPTYLYIAINCTVHYNSNNTTHTNNDIETIVRNAILNYGQQYLDDFGDVLRFSQLSDAIDSAEQSIVNNSTRIRLSIDVQPVYDNDYSYTVSINNAIYQPNSPSSSISSSGFYCTDGPENELCYLDDDPVNKTIRLYRRDANDNKVIIRANCGTVDYENGTFTIDNLNITAIDGGLLTFTINPSSYDVIGSLNQFAVIDNDQLVIDVINDATNSKYVQTTIK